MEPVVDVVDVPVVDVVVVDVVVVDVDVVVVVVVEAVEQMSPVCSHPLSHVQGGEPV